ncbi:HCP-like protein [Dentipellis sp. KUC8613]|nr:HCP-like protein [Dentipellis sp. KUC8613]
MGRTRNARARKASWLAFGLIALAAASAAVPDLRTAVTDPTRLDKTITAATAVASVASSGETVGTQDAQNEDSADLAASEAARAYRSALATLNALTTLQYTSQPNPPPNTPGSSIISYVFPNFQGQGPVGTALRILVKLWYRFTTSRAGKDALGGKRRRDDELRSRAIKVVDLLLHAADLGHTDALFTLAKISMLPPTPDFPIRPDLAYRTFTKHADLTGNGTSQAALAFFHSTGYRGIVPVDQAKAQLYYTFAAHNGDKGAQMALGYRYWMGVGVAEDCDRALEWYEHAAETAMQKFLSGPPGGRALPLSPARLSDLDGGVYGHGASVASTGMNMAKPAIKAARARAAGETWEDILEYYIFNADRGETDFAFRLGKIFYQGSIYSAPGGIASGGEGVGRVPRDFERARYYFERITRQVWPQDAADVSAQNTRQDGPVGYAAAAAGYLGRMYLRGEGVRQNVALAKVWFERGAEYGDKECHNGLGIMWRDGLHGRKDVKGALRHFEIAAGQDLAEAQVNLGKYYYGVKDTKRATTYLEMALRHGSPFEAYYYLSLIQKEHMQLMPPAMKGGACSVALSFYKIVAERGSWGDDPLRDGERDWDTGTAVGKENAMLRWWIAAERGYEMAQNNLAYVLDQDKSVLKDPRFTSFSPSNDTARLALTQWIRSAAQNNVDALVKVGDYYYHGLGVPDEPKEDRFEKAAGYYQSAADTQVSALAMWSLGWMYENGIGVPQDFHLAKRHYDVALETNAEAYLPVTLSLLKLHARSFWHTLTGGKDGLSIWESEEDSCGRADPESPRQQQQQLAEGQTLDGSTQDVQDELEEQKEYLEDDGTWYLGRARDEYRRRRGDQTPGGDEDPIEWARERRNAEAERDSDFGPEDYFDAATRGGHRGEEAADEFAETVMLVGLCLVVTLLLYIRGRMVERLRREAREQNGNEQEQAAPQPQIQANGGLFPPEGDPARDEWAIVR